MKRLTLILIIVWVIVLAILLSLALGAEVILQWDRNAPADQVTGYRVHNTARPFANTTTNRIMLGNISTSRRYQFTVTAVNATAESGPSNMVEVLIPAAPTNSRMIIKGGLEIQ
jgi:hypothetical protein